MATNYSRSRERQRVVSAGIPPLAGARGCGARGRVLALCLSLVSVAGVAAGPIEIGDRRELFVDEYLIDRLENVRLTLGSPRAENIALRFDKPWEGPHSAYVSVIKDEDTYRMYYRGMSSGQQGYINAVTCYAESRDGINWTKPELGLHPHDNDRRTNIVWPKDDLRISDNFAPFMDTRPGVPASERYKAIGGNRIKGLYRVVSADGVRWRLFSEEAIFANYALDSINVAMWLPAEKVYAIYLRTPGQANDEAPESYKKSVRSVSRSVSKDFVTWSKPESMEFGGTPMEHLYTTATHPYFRAPHLLIALPLRYVPKRQALSVAEMDAWGVGESHRVALSDVVLMSSRGGNRYDRTFMEAFVRPGQDRRAWYARNLFPARDVVPTAESEMSLYLTTHYSVPDAHIRRYSLRFDGFASARAPYSGGTLLTKPVIFSGRKLTINYGTSAVGSVKVELLDENGSALAGYSVADCTEIVGDEIERVVAWKEGTDLGNLAGRSVRLRFLLKDADLYSFRFRP